eukprot:TRINITY_DN2766_c0_g1_i1.p1 TRINITY_DN2766_c0_g1~~TRINITY_DN2766_c0_g1_i1.p1  ORF type:complete len:129 (-),score=17.17 TRINITY_DN2766_c0_g1_i1:42-428(-)
MVEFRSVQGSSSREIVDIRMYDVQLSNFGLGEKTPVVEARFDGSREVVVILRHPKCNYEQTIATDGREGKNNYGELKLKFVYHPSTSRIKDGCLLEEPWTQRCKKVSEFYSSLWVTSKKKKVPTATLR